MSERETTSWQSDDPGLRERQRDVAVRFLKSYETGAVDESLCAPGWRPWSCFFGYAELDEFRPMLKAFIGLFPEGLHFTIEDTTVEDGRVAILATSQGVLADGQKYRNSYHFFVRMDGEQVIEIREFMDTALAGRMIMPLVS